MRAYGQKTSGLYAKQTPKKQDEANMRGLPALESMTFTVGGRAHLGQPDVLQCAGVQGITRLGSCRAGVRGVRRSCCRARGAGGGRSCLANGWAVRGEGRACLRTAWRRPGMSLARWVSCERWCGYSDEQRLIWNTLMRTSTRAGRALSSAISCAIWSARRTAGWGRWGSRPRRGGCGLATPGSAGNAHRRARLHRVVGLCRFLIRPGVSCRNLASHVLGQAARRVSSACGHRPWLLETFVDEREHTGASFRAANRVGDPRCRPRDTQGGVSVRTRATASRRRRPRRWRPARECRVLTSSAWATAAGRYGTVSDAITGATNGARALVKGHYRLIDQPADGEVTWRTLHRERTHALGVHAHRDQPAELHAHCPRRGRRVASARGAQVVSLDRGVARLRRKCPTPAWCAPWTTSWRARREHAPTVELLVRAKVDRVLGAGYRRRRQPGLAAPVRDDAQRPGARRLHRRGQAAKRARQGQQAGQKAQAPRPPGRDDAAPRTGCAAVPRGRRRSRCGWCTPARSSRPRTPSRYACSPTLLTGVDANYYALRWRLPSNPAAERTKLERASSTWSWAGASN